ncbi:ATP-binding protein [Streptomyces sp. AC602_WCS936]|uniref:ATP-binding protein n=1 Tax=Streptomyces sp. AC602_WCS936 TaxID=2823685 RepID=UPI001C254D3F|nr:ATP-binding protein [Streptomyces sp. AC602_WCS936]
MKATCELAGCRDTQSARLVRDGVRDQLDRWGTGALGPDAELVVTELLSNALRHGRPPVRVALTVLCAPHGLPSVRVEVTDAGAAFDTGRVRARWRHPSFGWAESGRGLFLVDALCSRWGDRPAGGGHTVWADLG